MNVDPAASPNARFQEKKSRLVDRIRRRLAEVDAAMVLIDADMTRHVEQRSKLDQEIASLEADIRRIQARATDEQQAAEVLLDVLEKEFSDLDTLDLRPGRITHVS